MCLPFICGGGDKGDEYRPPQQAPPPPSAGMMYVPPLPGEEDNGRSYKPSPTQQAYDGHHGTNTPAVAGGEGKNFGGARPAPQGYVADVNKNGGGGRMTAPLGYSGDDVQGRDTQSAAGRIAVASTTPATQGFNTNNHWDLPAAQQAPPQRTHHGHGHGSSAASHPSEAADHMRAPLQARPMARRGAQDY